MILFMLSLLLIFSLKIAGSGGRAPAKCNPETRPASPARERVRREWRNLVGGCASDETPPSPSIVLLDFARFADNFWMVLGICDQEIKG